MKVDPDCHYITPKNYVHPNPLQILKECVKQDTYKPDIKPLELKLAKENTNLKNKGEKNELRML